jgi:PAS domain S-box-containing protein
MYDEDRRRAPRATPRSPMGRILPGSTQIRIVNFAMRSTPFPDGIQTDRLRRPTTAAARAGAGSVDLPVEVRRILAHRLLTEPAIAEMGHVMLAILVAVLLWPVLPDSRVILWSAGICLITVVRLIVRRVIARATPRIDHVPTVVRVAVIATGATWGLGTLFLAPRIPVTELALVMVVFCGLAAAATSTLLGDPPSYYGFMLSMLGAMAAALLPNTASRPHAAALVLVVLFGGVSVLSYRRAHATLVEYLTTARSLDQSRAAMQVSHQFLDRLIRSVPSAVVVLDGEEYVTQVNPAFERLFGYSSDEVEGRKLEDLIVPREQIEWSRAMRDEISRSGTMTHEAERCRKDGSRVHVRIGGARVDPDSGTVLIVYDDMQDEIALRVALDNARRSAEQAGAAKSALLANMSHEIRTPIAGVLGLTHLVLDGKLTPEQRRSVELIAESGQTLLRIVNDLLDLSKIEAEQLEIETTDFDLHALISSTVRLLTPGHTVPDLDIVVDIAAGVPRYVTGDPTRLRQVLGNLLGNAIKFTPSGRIVVSVAGAGDDRSPDLVWFGIRDTGIGIAPDALKKIFEPFRQADVSTTRKYGGTGLGLSISRRLVELMSGRLEVESSPGAGSEFHFTIPLPAAAAPPDEASVTLPGDRAAPPARRMVRVLIAEDNAVNQEVASTLLRRRGHRVDVVNNGKEAVNAVRTTPYDIVLMDLQMPEMDGIEATTLIRREGGGAAGTGLRIVAVTADVLAGERERCLAAGMNGYLGKPFAPGALIALVEAAAQPDSARASPHRGTDAHRPLDVEALRAEFRSANIEEALDPILEIFRSSAPGQFALLEAAVRDADAPLIERAAHSLKSAAGTVRANELTRLLQELEVRARSGDLTRAHGLFDRIHQEYDAALDQVSEALSA